MAAAWGLRVTRKKEGKRFASSVAGKLAFELKQKLLLKKTVKLKSKLNRLTFK